jgi:hypothetical protein
MIFPENRFPLSGIMLREARPDPSRSLTRSAGAFKPPTASSGAPDRNWFDPADFSGSV